jgi:hypothetical protein
MENIPTTVLNAGVPEYASTRKSRASVSYVRAPLYANMVAINNIAMIVVLLVSVNMVSVAVAVKSVPEVLFALIKDFVADVRIVEVVNYVSISDGVNYALNAKEAQSVRINYAGTDVLNAGEETYANMAETRTGVSPVMVQMYVSMTGLEHNVSCVKDASFALIKSAEPFVENAQASISVLTRNQKMYVWNVRGQPFVSTEKYVLYVYTVVGLLCAFMIEFDIAVSSVIPKSPANTVNTSISPALVGNPTASVATVSSTPTTLFLAAFV